MSEKPPTRPSNIRRALVAGAVIGTLFACSTKDDDNFREDVIYCEDALSKLSNCCPNFNTQAVTCYYEFDQLNNGCTTTEYAVNPDLDISDSRCILARDCNTLVSSGVCATAEKAHDPTISGKIGAVCQ